MNHPVSDSTYFPTLRGVLRFVGTGRNRRVLVFILACLVTLIALFYAEEDWRGRRAMNRFAAEIAARGDSLNLAALVPPRIPDWTNFVATPYMALVFQRPAQNQITNVWPSVYSQAAHNAEPIHDGDRHFTDLVTWQQALDGTSTNRTRPRTVPERTATEQAEAARAVLQKLEVYQPVLNEFRANMDRPLSRYAVDYLGTEPYAILLPHLSKIRGVADVVRLRVSAELAAGESQAALDDELLLLRLAESLKDEPIVISQLVRLAILQTAIQPLWEGLNARRWSGEQIRRLQERMDEIDVIADLPRCLSVERAASLATIDLARQRGVGTYLDVVSDPGTTFDVPTFYNILGHIVPRGWFYLEQVTCGRIFDSQVQISRRRPFDPVAAEESAASTTKDLFENHGLASVLHHTVAARLLVPAVSKLSAKFAIGDITARQAATACALERYRETHGEYPRQLQSLLSGHLKALPLDLFTGKPMSFRTDGKSFLLYSIGQNRRDDGGTPGRVPFDPDHGDWVWRGGQK